MINFFQGDTTKGLLLTVICYSIGYIVLNNYLIMNGISENQSLFSYTKATLCCLLMFSPFSIFYFIGDYKNYINSLEKKINSYLKIKLKNTNVICRKLIVSSITFTVESYIIGFLFIIINFILYYTVYYGLDNSVKFIHIRDITILSTGVYVVIYWYFYLYYVITINIDIQNILVNKFFKGIIYLSGIAFIFFMLSEFGKNIYGVIPYHVGGGFYPFRKQYVIKPDNIKNIDGFSFQIDDKCLITDTLCIIYENDTKVYVKNIYKKTIGLNKDLFNGEIIIPNK